MIVDVGKTFFFFFDAIYKNRQYLCFKKKQKNVFCLTAFAAAITAFLVMITVNAYDDNYDDDQKAEADGNDDDVGGGSGDVMGWGVLVSSMNF